MQEGELLRVIEAAIAEHSADAHPNPFTGCSAVTQRLSEEAHRLASSDAPVLLVGERGAGKSTIAQWLHRASTRARFRFVRISCADRSEEILEDELFGTEASLGASTAVTRGGALETVAGGSILLEEATAASPWVQDRIRQAIVSQRASRVGAASERRVNFRLFASTSRPLDRQSLENPLLAEVLTRSGGSPLVVPPLRERPDDLAALAVAILERAAASHRSAACALTPASLEKLRGYPWPGNLRELRMVLERAVLLSAHSGIEPHHLRLGEDALDHGVALATRATLNDIEREYVLQVFRAAHQNVAEAALRLGIPRSTLYQKLREYGERTPRRRLPHR